MVASLTADLRSAWCLLWERTGLASTFLSDDEWRSFTKGKNYHLTRGKTIISPLMQHDWDDNILDIHLRGETSKMECPINHRSTNKAYIAARAGHEASMVQHMNLRSIWHRVTVERIFSIQKANISAAWCMHCSHNMWLDIPVPRERDIYLHLWMTIFEWQARPW